MDEKEVMTLEEGFSRLETLTKQMDQGDMPLEERFELYKKGVELVKFCSSRIDMVEKELQIVREDSLLGEMEENNEF